MHSCRQKRDNPKILPPHNRVEYTTRDIKKGGPMRSSQGERMYNEKMYENSGYRQSTE